MASSKSDGSFHQAISYWCKVSVGHCSDVSKILWNALMCIVCDASSKCEYLWSPCVERCTFRTKKTAKTEDWILDSF